jgi:hypothetical protein
MLCTSKRVTRRRILKSITAMLRKSDDHWEGELMAKTDVELMVSYLYSWAILRRMMKLHCDGEDTLYALGVLLAEHGSRREQSAVMPRLRSLTERDSREYWHRVALILSNELPISVIDNMAKSMSAVMQGG